MADVIALGEVMLRFDPGEGRIRTARSFQDGALLMTTPGDVSMANLTEVEALIAGATAHVRRRTTLSGAPLAPPEDPSHPSQGHRTRIRRLSDRQPLPGHHPHASAVALDTAWDAGIRYFDTAPHYGLGLSERRLGAALRDRPRDEYVVSSKVGRLLVSNEHPRGIDDQGFVVRDDLRRQWDFSRDGVLRSLEDTLQRSTVAESDIASAAGRRRRPRAAGCLPPLRGAGDREREHRRLQKVCSGDGCGAAVPIRNGGDAVPRLRWAPRPW